MANDDEIDPTKVCTGLSGLITARLEVAYQSVVNGPSAKMDDDQIGAFVSEVRPE